MPRHPLGPNGPLVSDFCLGTMTFGGQTPLAEAHRQIDMAIEHGITFVDCAEMYPVNPVSPATRGHSEAVIGAWNAKGGRDRLVIATKVTGEGSDVIEGGTPMIDAKRLRSAVDEALTRLATDRIEVYQLHWPNRSSYHFRNNWDYKPVGKAAEIRTNLRAVLEEGAALIAAGKIGHLAVSNETAWGLAQWLRLGEAEGLPRVAAVQNEYSLLCRMFDTDMAEACALEDVPLMAYSPLATGLLTGKYAGDVTPENSRRAAYPGLGGRITPRVFEAVSAYLGLARDWGVDPVRMALAWHRTRPFLSIPILGATTVAQLAHQLPALQLRLEPELVAAIDAVHRAHPLPY